MSNTESSHYRKVPILTKVNFPKWEIQVISYLTGTADHVRIIEHCWGSNNTLVDPTCPTDTAAQAKWDASEWEALGVIMSTASDLHLEIILRHQTTGDPVYSLWKKICGLHCSADASLHHEA